MEIFEKVLHVSIAGGGGILVLSIFWKIFGKKCRAKSRKIGWILIAIYLVLPFSLPKSQSAYTVVIPEIILREQDGMEVEDVLLMEKIESGIKMPILEQDRPKRKVGKIVFWSWIFGVLLLSTYNLAGYWVTYRKSMRRSVECKDETVINRIVQLAKEISLRKLPALRIKTDSEGPFTMGVIRKIIYLPEVIPEDNKLEYILKHEMTHCKENDNFWKLFFLAVNVVHWFNPMVWLMRKFADQDMELVCDENVVRNASQAEKREYGGLLIDSLEGQVGKKHKNVFSADYAAGRRFMEKRFEYIFDRNIKRSGWGGIGVLFAVLFLIDNMTKVEVKGNMNRTDVPMEEFWNLVEVESENIWRFATGLEITFPKEWNGKIVTETDCWPSPVPTSDILVICEKTNAKAGWGGDLFYLSFRLYQGWDMVTMTGTLLGVYEQNGQKYILELSMPGSLSYVEGDEECKVAYEELSMRVSDVRINTDWMEGFTQCGIDDLEWMHDDSWLETR